MLGLERLRPLAWAGLLISLVGTAGIVISGSAEIEIGRSVLFGNLIMVLAAFLWGAYTTMMRPLVARHSPLGLTFFGVVVALPILVLVALPYLGDIHWADIRPVVWIGVAASGGLSTGVAIVLWNDSVRAVGARHTAAYQNAIPIVALIASAALLAEPILVGQIAGGFLTIIGLLMMRRARRPA
jgi:drug/metabolite transporter (DMT)-like permease